MYATGDLSFIISMQHIEYNSTNNNQAHDNIYNRFLQTFGFWYFEFSAPSDKESSCRVHM